MVTGERLFRGESLHETIAAALTTDPRWECVPPAVLPLLRACLERDPLKRLRDVGDYQFLLARSEAVPASIRRSPVRSWAIATAALTALILAFLAGKSLSRDEIYYRRGPRLMATRVDKTAGVKVLTSRVVIDPFLPPLYDDDVHSDGRTLVMVRPVNETQGREVRMVIDWFNEFRRAAR
jgi:hypothetical protein